MQVIQQLQIEDLAVIQMFEQQNDFPWTEGMLRDCFLANDEVYGVVLNKKIIAYVIVRYVLDEAEILNITVDKQFRRQGYGQALLEAILKMAQQRSIQKVYLEVRATNFSALNLYEKLGFKKIGERKDYYPAKKGRETAIQLCMVFT